MIDTVIFDLDGLIADTEMIVYNTYVEILKEFNKEISIKEYIENFCGGTLKDNARKFIEIYDLNWDYDTNLEKIVKKEAELLKDKVNLKPGAFEILKYLNSKGYKIGLATSSVKQRAMNILEKNKVEKYFDSFVFSEDVNIGKPNPQVFLKSLEKLNSKKENSLVIEDSEFGILAANKAGIQVICVPDLKHPREEYLKMTYKVLDTLIELTNIL